MDQNDFRQKLLDWGMNARNAIIPTNVEILLYGHTRKTRIIPQKHESLVYTCVSPVKVAPPEGNKNIF